MKLAEVKLLKRPEIQKPQLLIKALGPLEYLMRKENATWTLVDLNVFPIFDSFCNSETIPIRK